MPQLIKQIEGSVFRNNIGEISFLTPISGQVQEEDYINLNGFIGYLQNLSRAEVTSRLDKPLNFGLVNLKNIEITTLEISY